MKIIARVMAIGLVLAALLVGGLWLFQNQTGSRAEAQTGSDMSQVVAVQQGSIEATISVVGEVYAPQSETLRFEREAGTTDLFTLEAAAGNVVEASQVLATIDPSPYQQILGQAQSDLQQAEERLADLLTPATDLEVAQADLAIAQAELALQQAQDEVDSLLAPDIDELRSAVAAAQLDLAEAQANQLTLEVESTYEDQLYRLQETEAAAYAEYSRLANETYSDTYYQDRLRLALNAYLDAQDTRITYETQRHVNQLEAQVSVTRAQRSLADAQENLADAESGSDELELAQARQAVAQAEGDLAQAKATAILRGLGANDDLDFSVQNQADIVDTVSERSSAFGSLADLATRGVE